MQQRKELRLYALILILSFSTTTLSQSSVQQEQFSRDEIPQIDVGEQPSSIAVNSNTDKIYVANEGSNSVSVIDGKTNGVTTIIQISKPTQIAVNMGTNKLYVVSNNNTVFVIDGDTNKNVKNYTVDYPARLIVVNPKTNKIYVTHFGSPTILIIDESTSRVTSVSAPGGPYDISLNPKTNKIISSMSHFMSFFFFNPINNLNSQYLMKKYAFAFFIFYSRVY